MNRHFQPRRSESSSEGGRPEKLPAPDLSLGVLLPLFLLSLHALAGETFTVRPSGTNVAISPGSASGVKAGARQTFTVTAKAGYVLSNVVGGSCPLGSFKKSTYTTGEIEENCTLSFSAALPLYKVSPAGLHVSISPDAVQSVRAGSPVSFSIAPSSGYRFGPSPVSGTCPAGSWSGWTYTTGAIATNCSIGFAAVAVPVTTATATATSSATATRTETSTSTATQTQTRTQTSTSTSTATRNVLQQPFASASIWNMPIGSGATYAPANIPTPEGYKVSKFDGEHIILSPASPLVNVYYNGAGWSGGSRCAAQGGVIAQMPVPSGYVVPSDGENDCAASLLPDGQTIVQLEPLAVCSAGGVATGLVAWPGVNIYGDGIAGAHGGSGLSAIGGSLRIGELRPGMTGPAHALKVIVQADTSLYNCSTTSECFTWPASTADGYAVGYYGSAQAGPPAMKQGALLALPASLNIASLGLQTGPAKQLAWTLQNYGAYVVDDTYGDGFGFAGEDSPVGNFTSQFQADYGYAFTANAGDGSAWSKDLQLLITHLSVITNNGPSSIGGGGIPLQPLAAPVAAP